MADFTSVQMAFLAVGLIAAAISAGMLAGLLGVGGRYRAGAGTLLDDDPHQVSGRNLDAHGRGDIVDDNHFHVIGLRPVPSRAWVLGCVFDQALVGWHNDRCTMWGACSKVYKR